MRSRRKRTAAVAPSGRIERTDGVAQDGLTVEVRVEDGTKTFECSDVPASDLLFTLIAAFARRTSLAGSWRRLATARAGWGDLTRLAKYLAAAHPGVTSIDRFTPEVWWAWRTHVESGARRPSSITMTRTLLKGAQGLPADTRRALNAIIRDEPREQHSHSRSEFLRILRAAWRVFRIARARIAENERRLAQYRAGEEPEDSLRVRIRGREWTIGEILDHISRTGEMPPGLSSKSRGALRAALGVGKRRLPTALFPTLHENCTAMIIFACLQGYNSSVMANLRLSDAEVFWNQGQPHVRLHLYKARSKKDRTETLTGRAARHWLRTVGLTQPARDTHAALGQQADQLFIARLGNRTRQGPSGLFTTDWSRTDYATDEWNRLVTIQGDDGAPLSASLQRIRLTEQVLNWQARQNTPSVSESTYRLPDPRTAEQVRPVVLRGLQDALEDAERTVARRVTRDDLANPRTLTDKFSISLERASEVARMLPDGQLDTVTTACVDFMHSPHECDAGGPCTVSFLLCLICPNGIVTEAHLPRLLATREAVVATARSSRDVQRKGGYSKYVAAIDDVLGQFSDAQVERAKGELTPDDSRQIMRLLSGRLDP